MTDSAYEVFYIDKGGSPFSDLLVVFGWAELLWKLLDQEAMYNLEIQDQGTCYAMRCSPAISPQMLERRILLEYPIRTAKTKLPDTITTVYDYDEHKERVNAYFASRKLNIDAEKPASEWDVLRAINPAALPGYNSLMVDWHQVMGEDGNSAVLMLLCDLFSQTPNNISAAIDRWKQLDKAHGWGIAAETTAQQLYNPDSGKGQNRAKASGLSIGNIDSFWLLEWLKAVGFYKGAFTRLVRGGKDRKTFVVAPRELTYHEHNLVMSQFLDGMQVSETSIRFDILAITRYTLALLNHLFASGRTRGRVKKHVVSGFYTAFYKDMGNAVATMNMAFLALPGWVNLQGPDDVAVYHALLEEFGMFVRQFDETHSDGFALLQHLRDFISGDDLRAFFRFTNAFPGYLMGMQDRNKWAKPLTTGFIEGLIMSSEKSLSSILATPGFQNIAYAIRRSTITPQYLKKQGVRKYDIRYGLGQELARKARYPHEFIAALADFLHKYNAENAQIMETRPGPYRRSVQTSDIDDVIRLIDEHGSETVANLLIAYGYARPPREAQDEEIPDDIQNDGVEAE